MRLIGASFLAGGLTGAAALACAPAAAQEPSLSAFQEFFDSAGEVNGETSSGLRLRRLENVDDSTLTFTSPDFGQLPGDFGFLPGTSEASSRSVFDGASADERDNAAFSLGYGAELDGLGLEATVVGAYPTANAEPGNQAYGIGGGLAVSFSGFTLAGGTAWDDADGDGGEDWRTDLGIAYGEGPWRVSLSGIYTADSASGEAMLGSAADVRYNLATGVSFFAIGYLGREEAGADGGSDVVAVSSGIKLSF